MKRKNGGLPNFRTTVDALPTLRDPEVIALFEKYGVLSKRETESRVDIYLEQYVKTISTESRLVIEIANTMILPAACPLPRRIGRDVRQSQGGRLRAAQWHAG